MSPGSTGKAADGVHAAVRVIDLGLASRYLRPASPLPRQAFPSICCPNVGSSRSAEGRPAIFKTNVISRGQRSQVQRAMVAESPGLNLSTSHRQLLIHLAAQTGALKEKETPPTSTAAPSRDTGKALRRQTNASSASDGGQRDAPREGHLVGFGAARLDPYPVSLASGSHCL